MKSEKTSPKTEPAEPWEREGYPPAEDSLRSWLRTIIICGVLGLIAVILAVLIGGCTTTPQTVRSTTASVDGNLNNSGVLGKSPSGGYVITKNARLRYNGLSLVYGGWFIPSNSVDAGITIGPSNAFTIDQEHMIRFGLMTSWRIGNKPAFKP